MASSETYEHKFIWEGGGTKVFVCGNFNGWRKIPMAKSRSKAGVFTTSVNVPNGRYEYKFDVDGEDMLDVNQERISNDSGALLNVFYAPEVSSAMSQDVQDNVTLEKSDEELSVDSSESDTESTASSIDLMAIQPFVKLNVKCFAAPSILKKDDLENHLKLYNFFDNVTDLKLNTTRKGKKSITLHVSPPQIGEKVVATLHHSMLLGKYKLTVQKQKRSRRRKESSSKPKRVSKKDVPVSKATKLYVGSLPRFTTKNHLEKHFASFKDKIVDVYVVKDENKQCKGFGFVTFIDEVSANSAVSEMNGSMLLNKHCIKVNVAKRDKETTLPVDPAPHIVIPDDDDVSDSESVASLSEEPCQLFVNSTPPLTDKIKNKQIADQFSAYRGFIKSAKVIRDKERKSKGYAIVTFTNAEMAEEAAKVYDGSKFLGTFTLAVRTKQRNKKAATSHAKIKLPDKSESTPLLKEIPNTQSNKVQQFTVKITCLPHSITTEWLTDILRVFGEISSPVEIRGSKNRFAFVNFTTLSAAQLAESELDNTVLDGYTIKVSLKGDCGSKSSTSSEPPTPTSTLPHFNVPSPTATQWTVSLDNVDSLISDDELKAMIPVPLLKLNRSSPSKLLVNVSTLEYAQSVVHALNGKPFLGKTIEATLVQTVPYHQQHSAPPLVQNYYEQNKPLTSLPGTVPTPPLMTTSSNPPPQGVEQSLTLSPCDWNRLMIAGPSGRLLYQDIIEPYKTNPSIQIREDMSTRTVFFSGIPNAVNSAYARLTSEVFKELIVEDRFKKMSLVTLRPDVLPLLQQKYGVTLLNYNELSPVLTLQGNGNQFENARQELEKVLSGIKRAEVPLTLSNCLLDSAREQFCVDRVQVCIFICDTKPDTLLLYALSDQTLFTASKALHLATEIIDNVPTKIYHEVIPTFQCSRLVEIKPFKQGILVQSYLKQECVNTAYRLRERLKTSLSLQSPVQGNADEIAYLIHLHKTDYREREQLSSLPAEFVIQKKAAFLKGTAQAVEAAQMQIRQQFLSNIFFRRFMYQNRKFVSQLEDFVLKPASSDVVLIMQEQKKNSDKQRKRPDESDVSIDIIICSKNAEMFHSLCSSLENVKPSHRKLTLPGGAARSIKLDESKSELEKKHRVRILTRNDALTIHGLTTREVYDCETEIKSKIETCHEVSKYITLTNQQRGFINMKRKQVLDKLKERCNDLRIFQSKNDTETYLIQIKGPIKIVEGVYETLVEMKDGLTTVKFDIQYERRFYPMWKKRWDHIKKDKEGSCDVTVYISTEPNQSSASKNEVTFTTIYIVGEQSQVVQIQEVFLQTATVAKSLPLTAAAANTLKKDKKEFLWPLAVYFNIKNQNRTFELELIAPEDFEDHLDTAEEEIQKFLGEYTKTTKNITCNSEVVGLVLNSRTKYAKYLMLAVSIGQKCGVKVTVLRKPLSGLKLSGTAPDIQSVEQPLITQVLKPIESGVAHDQLRVSSMFQSVLSTSSYLQFVSKLRDDLCVVCTFPRSNKTNKIVRSAMIQPSSTARCLKLELCHGSVVFEQSDAIVNAANENLQHIGGLAKAIQDVGGQAIQTESDSYVKDHGKLKPGEVVSLGPGSLLCKAIFHAVGPRWKTGNEGEETLLYITILKCLALANSSQYETVSLPAISAGIFGVPLNICARASLKAVQDFCQSYPNSTLHTVRFVLYNEMEVYKFCWYFDSGALTLSNTSTSSQVGDSTASPTASTSGTWLWTNDLGTLTPFTSDISQQLSTAFSVNPHGSCTFSLLGVAYCVDFPTRTQTNVRTGHRRIVKYDASISSLSSKGTACWYFVDDRKGFSPYTPSDSLKIERMYQDGVPGNLIINQNVYTFDFNSMSQINTKTNYKRRLLRKEIAAGHTSPKTVLKTSSAPVHQEVCISLCGPRDSMEAAKSKILNKLESHKMKDKIPIRFVLSPEFSSKLHKIAIENNVDFRIAENQAGSKTESVISLQGIDHDVQGVVKKMQQLIIDHQLHRTTGELEVAVPPEWQDQTSNTEVFSVPRGCPEWTKVEQKFNTTLANKIVSISRVQNRWLWEAYCAHKRRLHLKNDGNVNEMDLFHGTRRNDPKVIYEGENGFDMRYSNKGMWGTANYFAVNASYSDTYCFQTSDGHKEMFLVKVLTGDSYRCASDSSLRKPPEKSNGSRGGKLGFSKVDYDSVNGHTHGSQVYMTYDNDKAYPAYLIKYI